MIDFIKIQPGKRTKVKILADCKVAGEHLPAGKVVELSDEDAVQLISIAKAARYEEEEVLATAHDSSGITEQIVKPRKGKRR
jgi:hypothetical protein